MCKKNLTTFQIREKKPKNFELKHLLWNTLSLTVPLQMLQLPKLLYSLVILFQKGTCLSLEGKKGSRKCLSFMAFKIFIHLSMLIGTRCLQLQAQMVQNKHDSFFAEINYEQIQNLLSCSYFSLLRRKCVQGLNVIVFLWAAFSYFGTAFFKNSYRHLSSSTSLSKCPSCTHR